MRDKEGSFLGLAYDVRKPYERRPGNLDGLLHPAEGGAARLPLFASSRCRPRHRSSSRTAHPPRFGHSSRPHQNQQRRSRRSRLSHRPAGQGVECLNGCREDRERRVFRFPRRWSSQAIVRCNRLRAITLARPGAAVGRRARNLASCRKVDCWSKVSTQDREGLAYVKRWRCVRAMK